MRKYTKTNEADITAAVGEFISKIRNGNHKPSMRMCLRKRGIDSSCRAKSLIEKMLKNGIIKESEEGFYELTKLNYEAREIMPILLKREYKRNITNPLSKFKPEQLVKELRDRGYEVTCLKHVIEEL